MKLHLTATGCHLPCVITLCFLPRDMAQLTSEHTFLFRRLSMALWLCIGEMQSHSQALFHKIDPLLQSITPFVTELVSKPVALSQWAEVYKKYRKTSNRIPGLLLVCVFFKGSYQCRWPYCPVEHLFYMLFYFICTACTCLCSQINDDDDQNKLLLPPAFIRDPASIKTLSSCHATVINFYIQYVQLQLPQTVYCETCLPVFFILSKQQP